MYKTLIAAASLLLAVGSYAQNSKLLLVKGKKYETATTIKSVMEVQGQEMTDIQLNIETFEVKDTRPGKTDLVAITKRITTKVAGVDSLDEEVVFDSDKKDMDNPYMKAIMKIIGKPRNISIDASGKIIKQDEEDEKANFTMLSISGGLGNSPALFWPSVIGRPITTGASWPDSSAYDYTTGKGRAMGIFTVKSIGNNITTIAFNGTATRVTIVEADEMVFKEMTKLKTNSQVTGEAKIDMKTGLIIESNCTSEDNTAVETGKQTSSFSGKTMYNTKMKAL